MKYDFIEIGTSDFRTLAHTVNGIGISVEPVKEYFDRLPNREGLILINAAVSDTNKTVDVHFCRPDVLTALGLPAWLRGCNSIEIPHPTVVNYCKDNNVDYDQLVGTQEIHCITLAELFKNHLVDEVTFLKIDTEGHDYFIMKSLFELMSLGTCPKIDKIQFESNVLMVPSNHKQLIEMAESHGYEWNTKEERGNRDTILKLRK